MLGIRKLDIFITKQFGMLFMGTFFICQFVLMMQFLWRYVDELIGKGLSLDVMAQFFWYMGLMLLPQALPLAILLARPLSAVFVGYDPELLDLTVRAFVICAVPFLLMWFNIYTSNFFTALNDGAVSAAISFMRSLVLPTVCIIVMPMIWKLDGVWYSLVASEVLAFFVSFGFMIGKRKKYRYG